MILKYYTLVLFETLLLVISLINFVGKKVQFRIQIEKVLQFI